MSSLQNRRFKLKARPVGEAKRSDFDFVTEPVGTPGSGEIVVKNLYISLDPAMRGWMNEGKSYIEPVALGEVMRAGAVGKVMASNDKKFVEGDYVVGLLGVQDYYVGKPNLLNKVDPRMAPLPRFLGALGMPGLTAYFGLLDVCNPQPGETVVVSGAAGAVGSLVGQIAKIKGCRAIGIAGGADKCRYIVEELGFDGAVDYKQENLYESLRKHCPKGIDVYFDNVGGEILDIVLTQLARFARISICGAISQYNRGMDNIQGPKYYLSLLINSARMQGFVVFDYAARYGEGLTELAKWISEGKLKAREDIQEGLENFPEVFLKLFKGDNLGKLVLKVADE